MLLFRNYYALLLIFVSFFASAQALNDDVVDISGTSIIGNKELPKSLFIVPWKNAEVGDNSALKDTLGDDTSIVDREVFVREIQYYEFLQKNN